MRNNNNEEKQILNNEQLLYMMLNIAALLNLLFSFPVFISYNFD